MKVKINVFLIFVQKFFMDFQKLKNVIKEKKNIAFHPKYFFTAVVDIDDRQ